MPIRPQRNQIRRPQRVGPESLAQRIRSSPRWQGLARAVLRRDPVCCDPVDLHVGVVTPTTEAHHIKGLRTHPELAYDMKNLKGLCGQCHDAVELLVYRGVDTTSLFAEVPAPSLNLKSCNARNNGFYCARMKTFRATKCAGCVL